jgi:hypothetical protein
MDELKHNGMWMGSYRKKQRERTWWGDVGLAKQVSDTTRLRFIGTCYTINPYRNMTLLDKRVSRFDMIITRK